MVSTLLLVVGALLVGEAIHAGVVTGEYAVSSPYVVLRAVLGSVAIALGYRLQSPVEEYVAMPSDEPDPSEASNDQSPAAEQSGEFDAAVSPLGDDGLEHVDTDDRDEQE